MKENFKINELMEKYLESGWESLLIQIIKSKELTKEIFDKIIETKKIYLDFDTFEMLLSCSFMDSDNLDSIIEVMHHYDEIFELATRSKLITLKSLESIYINKKSKNTKVLINIIENPVASTELKNLIFLETFDNELLKVFIDKKLVNQKVINSKKLKLIEIIRSCKKNNKSLNYLCNIVHYPLLDEELALEILNKIKIYKNTMYICDNEFTDILITIASSNILTSNIIEILIEICEITNSFVKADVFSQITGNSLTETKYLEKLVNLPPTSPVILINAINNPNTTEEIIDVCLNKSKFIYCWLAAASSLKATSKILRRIAFEYSPHLEIFEALLENPNTTEEILKIIKEKIIYLKFQNEEAKLTKEWAISYNNNLRRCLSILDNLNV